ncbi:P2X purinoceptor 6-like isoform X2 [Xenopus laevis]|uniref:P2X purinoceptor 6-like isoform X2 n=1 Tax=Xenopus laevis TaxID=8355 RepID=A0A8J1L5L3_XENLA|nr:P2X purinoceptor 6-like isoform X2 [Xenopus laevis]
MDAGCAQAQPALLDYKTEKYLLTKNRKVGVIYRFLHLAILCYIIGWVFLAKKGYQDTDSDPHFSIITKLKGVSITKNFRNSQEKIWDVADFVKPSQGENVLFLVTNFIATTGQVQRTCAENPVNSDARCSENLDCVAGEPVVNGNGIKTGKCVMFNHTQSTCEIYGWCPVENESLLRKPRLNEAENFTLFIKNVVHFSKFNFSRANTLDTSDETYFKNCRYNPVSSPYCPVFQIQEIITQAGQSFEELSVMGGVVAARIEWKCDLDRPAAECLPQYSFRLQDTKNNFRTATYYWDQERKEYRDLFKLYGFRFDISVTGEATFLCDLILLYLDKKASFYRSCKYEEVKPPKNQQTIQETRNE